MMEFLKKLGLKPAAIFKIAGIALVGIILVVFTVQFLKLSFGSIGTAVGNYKNFNILTPSAMTKGIAQVYEMDTASFGASGGMVGLSVRNAASAIMPYPEMGYTAGDDAEEFEVTEYNSYIETRSLDQACEAVANLKTREEVIFESANKYDTGCNFRFKVQKDNVEEILGIINGLNPKEVSENVYTIKNVVQDYTSELQILEKKQESIDATLDNAIKSYDNITTLATRIQDVESLAKIIESKLMIIERLTQEKINVSAQMERLARSKAEQLDRLEYTYFNVSVVENKFVDGERISDSWKAAVKKLVTDLNKVIQDITINLFGLLFLILQYVIYLLIILLVVKYGWKAAKYIWKK